MNYGEIKQNIISLGFAEEADYQEFEELGYTYDAINRAISEINISFPYIAKYEFDIDAEDDEVLYIDMTSVDQGFLEFGETPVLYEQDDSTMFKKFSDFHIEMEHTVVIEAANYHGSFRIYYEKKPTDVMESTADSFVPEVPLKAHHLIPLLASYYIWLDDDPTKAAQYYNMYETATNTLTEKEQTPRARIVTDWSVV
jgi:hypothetical protein